MPAIFTKRANKKQKRNLWHEKYREKVYYHLLLAKFSPLSKITRNKSILQARITRQRENGGTSHKGFNFLSGQLWWLNLKIWDKRVLQINLASINRSSKSWNKPTVTCSKMRSHSLDRLYYMNYISTIHYIINRPEDYCSSPSWEFLQRYDRDFFARLSTATKTQIVTYEKGNQMFIKRSIAFQMENLPHGFSLRRNRSAHIQRKSVKETTLGKSLN